MKRIYRTYQFHQVLKQFSTTEKIILSPMLNPYVRSSNPIWNSIHPTMSRVLLLHGSTAEASKVFHVQHSLDVSVDCCLQWTHKIDLEHPQQRFGILFDEHSNSVTFGWLQGSGPKGDESVERRASQRPFFKPVSLEPRLARLAVNLAGGPLQKGAILDPMTGTGGFAIEAALSGRNVVALDLDAEMIAGAKNNLEWSGSTANVFFQGDATDVKASIPNDGPQAFSGIVLDPPYGRNSQGSLDHEELLNQTLLSCSAVVENGSLVLILPSEPRELCLESALAPEERPQLIHFQWSELEQLLLDCNWKYEDAWYVFVHGSLGRVVIYASSVPQD